MSQHETSTAVVRELPKGFCLSRAFDRICTLPGVLWLDSASQPRDTNDSPQLGRYSFLTAEPVDQIVANVDESNPWPLLAEWFESLQSSVCQVKAIAGLPPFQGGIAGVIGYESGAWLEDTGVASYKDLPTPAMSLGLYDWTIAADHQTQRAWIVSQGIQAGWSRSHEVAAQKADRIESLVMDCVVDDAELHDSTPRFSVESNPVDRASVTSNFTSEQFQATVAEIVRRIRNGDSFQVNLAQRLLRKANLPAPQLYQRLRCANPAPFGGYFDGGNFTVLSSSPEGFLTVRDRVVETRPIKGTIHRTGDPATDDQLASQLRNSSKDRAENVMIVDLMRNDLSRVCKDDSVQVRKLCEIERYQYVQHLVSVVEGELRDDQSIIDLLQACFPGGSVTGAPKIEAMRTIAELEPNPRGPYCGSMGYISCGGVADFNILIRTITETDGFWQIPVGGGITARSSPVAEEAETWAKAEGMLRAVQD